MDKPILGQATNAALEKSQLDVSLPQAVRGLCTPAHHANTHKTKPIKLLELGTGPDGKTATFEFTEGWQRTLDFLTDADAWHPLFDELPQVERMQLREFIQAPYIKHADGTMRQTHAVSFNTNIRTKNGKYVDTKYFDIADEQYSEGRITGLKCASELLNVLARGYGPGLFMEEILKAAAIAANEKFSNCSRRSAGSAFLEIVEDAVKFFAKNARHQDYIQIKIAAAECYRDEVQELNALERAEFVERMKAAKVAKRTAKETEAA